MKTFLNVLYRRILYKIPLKLLLLLLVVFGVLFACFSNALEIPNDGFVNFDYDISAPGYEDSYFHYTNQYVNLSSSTKLTLDSEFQLVCFRKKDGSNGDWSLNGSTWYSLGVNTMTCWNGEGDFYIKNCVNNNCYSSYFKVGEGGLDCNNYTSLECQTEYNLIPISSVDQNYCTTNNLCPSCPVCPSVPVGTGGYSQLYINNILHLGAPNIIMNIPDEIDWDYAYTNSGQNMNIDVVGYNVDYEKIDSIVQFQNYKPTSEDFQKIIGLLVPYTKIIVFFVFLFIVWAWIKKPFKSKKL